jgi:hypothetical protein
MLLNIESGEHGTRFAESVEDMSIHDLGKEELQLGL